MAEATLCITPIAALRRAIHELRLSAGVFRDYGFQHQDKADGCGIPREKLDRQRKAKRNHDRAAACQEALERVDAIDLEALVQDAERFRALMRSGRIRMFGSAGFDTKTGEKTDKGWVHFGAEFWSRYDIKPEFQPEAEASTAWGRNALRALADDIIASEKADG